MLMQFIIPQPDLTKSLLRELWQNESGLVHLAAVVLEEFVLLSLADGAKWLLDVGFAVLGADHEADLAAWIGWDGGPAVLGDWEDGLDGLLEVLNHIQVQPWVLG